MRKMIPVFVCCAFLIISIPRLLSLNAHWNSDEARWLQRSENFMSAVKQGEFSNTLIAYHPGVMTMWIAGLRTYFVDAGIDVHNLIHARWFLGVVVLFGIGFSGILLFYLFGQWEAITGIVFLVFSPFLLAQTRRVHTDALATIFLLLTVLLLLLYCKNGQKHRYLILSGITYGLAVLSKSYSLILVLWVPMCLFLFWNYRENRSRRFFTSIAELFCFLNCALLTFLVLWPVFWKPAFGLLAASLLGITILLLDTLKKQNEQKWKSIFLLITTSIVLVLVSTIATRAVWLIFDRVNWAVTTPHEVEHFFLGKILYDPGWLFYPLVLTIKSTPLMLPLALIGCILLWKHRKDSTEASQNLRIALALVAVAVLFIVCLSGTSKKFSRYLLPAFSMLEISAAIGFVQGIKWVYNILSRHFGTEGTIPHKYIVVVIACIGIFFVQVFPVLALHPYYGTYYNPCWKVTDIKKIITVGEGSGLDIAAHYLNEKPNAEQLVIQVSPLAAEFVYHYSQGFVYRSDRNRGYHPDYEVVYIRDVQIGRLPQTGTRHGELECKITINGIEHVWIYKMIRK
ncbi:hypothetical protein F4083_11675 [Candidatus Poribacteria bacterium]|nr:hypothetical protein [Candidatus Poribacteria bacterium]MYB66097.1 hypothetical protein [Candidatus Poribacteria bacterium]MYF55013.1 hypothetical protein [Candidatus Poribacteria bacterium]MYI94955.1 hypothetical protein [Candidatus Poribacteria bacterium]